MRDFLKGLELDKEVIDSIMAEHGKEINSLKESIDNYKTKESELNTELETYKNQVGELNKTIEDKDKSLENLQNITNENFDLKAQIQMNSANVKKEFMKFVASEVKGKVDDKTDFSKALDDYKKENPQYFGETIIKKVQTSPELTGGETKPQTSNTIMNDIIRGSRN